jgi:hypothetical protein
MKTQVQLGSKSSSFMKRALVGFGGAKYALVLFLLMVVSAFAQTDYSAMTSGLETEISSAKAIIIGLGGAILGVSIVFVVYKLFRKMVG